MSSFPYLRANFYMRVTFSNERLFSFSQQICRVGGGFIYLLVVYLDFPYMFFGKKCFNRKGFGHFFFTPVTGIWFPMLRRFFYTALWLIFVADMASIFLTLMWIALGVVVNPALAIPYATGIIVFFTNLNNVRNSLANWQQMVVDEVLERLLPFLQSQLSDSGFSESVANIIDEVSVALGSTNSSSETANEFKPLLETLEKLKASLLLENPQEGMKFRKLKEEELVILLRSLWSSIREELGLSSRNIFIAVITSSLVLGSLLLFIFIGLSLLPSRNVIELVAEFISKMIFLICRSLRVLRRQRPIRIRDQFIVDRWRGSWYLIVRHILHWFRPR
jgi:hypothetical protein